MKKYEYTNTKRKTGGLIGSLNRLVRFFYERVPECCVTQWHHGRAYTDFTRREVVMVIYPLHYVVNFIWWLNWKWCDHRMKPSWIDRKKAQECSELLERVQKEYMELDDRLKKGKGVWPNHDYVKDDTWQSWKYTHTRLGFILNG